MKKDPKAVLTANRRRAEDGDKWAQEKLGMRLLAGDGVTRDEHEAKKWLQLAAEQGSQSATRTLEEINLRAPSRPAQSFKAEMERGLQLSFRGDHQMAAEAFFNCTEMAPADPAPCYNAACSYALAGQVDWACRYLNEAIDRGMEYSELVQDPDRDHIFGNDHRYAEVWLTAEQRSREARLHERDAKASARKAAMAEAELLARGQLDAERDLEAAVRESVLNAEQTDSIYKMKGLGVRSLLFETICALHNAERLLSTALRSSKLNMQKKRELDTVHQQIGRRFDVLCTKAASLKAGAAELERTLDKNDEKHAAEERERLDERIGEMMGEWDNDWEVAKHKHRLGISPVDPVSATELGMISVSEGTACAASAVSDVISTGTASSLHLSGKLDPISEADAADAWHGRSNVTFNGELSDSADLSRTGRTSISKAKSDRSSSDTGGRQEQLAFELALGSAAAAAGHGAGGHAAASSALADAERMLLKRGAAAGDPVMGYRWYRLCIGYAELGDEAAACRSFAAAADGGLHKVSEYGHDHPLRPRDHPVLAAFLASSDGASGDREMRALGLLIERFERSQDYAEQERRRAFLKRREKTSREMTPSDLMAEGISVNKAAEAAEQLWAMHMRRSGGLAGLIDSNELPALGATSQHRSTATANPHVRSTAVARSDATLEQYKLPALVPRPSARQLDPLPTGSPPTASTPGLAGGRGSLGTSSDLLLQETGAGASTELRAELGPDPREWSIDEVGRWLESQSLAMHCQTFAQHLVDGETLLSLTAHDISESLRVTKLGHCKVLAKGILALRVQARGEP